MAYPIYTSAKTGKTTWSDGSTSTYSNPTPVSSGTIGKKQSASVYSVISGLLSSISRLLGQQTSSALNTLSSGGAGVNTEGKSMLVKGDTRVYTPSGQLTSYGRQLASAGAIQAPIANQGVASKQAQTVVNSKGKAITGTYAKNSSGSYEAVPIQSLGYSGYTSNNADRVINIKKISDKLNLYLNDAKSNSWESNGTKADKITSLMESTAGEFGKNFNSVDDLNLSYNSNPTIKTALDQFIANGGTLEQIMGKIQANQQQAKPYTVQQGDTLGAIASRTGKSVEELMALNPQITNPNLIQAGSALNLGANVQDTTAYLSEIKKPYITDPEALLKLPQDKLIQNEIMRNANIPQEWRDYYLGTPEKMGVFEKEKAEKQAQLDLIEEKLADDKRAYREKVNLQIEKIRQELGVALAETETNRLKAKNYMTGLLAKLGALNTTGAAGEALVKLDQKYEEMKQNTTAKYTLAIREMEAELNEGLNDIENGYADQANKIREDLTKSAADITKELMKLDIESQSKIYSLSTSYAKLLQTQKEKALKALKTEADQYVTEFRSIVSTPGLDFSNANLSTLSGLTMKTTVPKAKFTQTERNKLIMAGLANAPQSEKLKYLYGNNKKPTGTLSGITDEQKAQALKELGLN